MSERFLYVDSPLLFESQVAAQSVIFHNQQSLREIVNEFHYRLTALERAGETTKPLYLKRCETCNKITCECPKPKPTAATVERFRAYRYHEVCPDCDSNGMKPDGQWCCHTRKIRYFDRKPIGEVVATFDESSGCYKFTLNDGTWILIPPPFKDILVGHNMKSGMWERTND